MLKQFQFFLNLQTYCFFFGVFFVNIVEITKCLKYIMICVRHCKAKFSLSKFLLLFRQKRINKIRQAKEKCIDIIRKTNVN